MVFRFIIIRSIWEHGWKERLVKIISKIKFLMWNGILDLGPFTVSECLSLHFFCCYLTEGSWFFQFYCSLSPLYSMKADECINFWHNIRMHYVHGVIAQTNGNIGSKFIIPMSNWFGSEEWCVYWLIWMI